MTRKTFVEDIVETVKAAAASIAHPADGTPMDMPLSETGYTLPHAPFDKKQTAKLDTPPVKKD